MRILYIDPRETLTSDFPEHYINVSLINGIDSVLVHLQQGPLNISLGHHHMVTDGQMKMFKEHGLDQG